MIEQVIKLNPLNVAGNEGCLRSQGQWHWVLILLHGLTLWEPGLFRYSPLYPGWKGEDPELPTEQGTLTALRTREGGRGGEREGKGRWGGGGNF